MHWEYIGEKAALIFGRAFLMYGAYWMSKYWTNKERSEINPHPVDRILPYAKCLLAVAFACGIGNQLFGNQDVLAVENRIAVDFIVFGACSMIGATEGFRCEDIKDPPNMQNYE